jgi:DNA topoisomerase I
VPTARRNLVDAIRAAADRLGNTPAVARGSYVHPAVAEAYLDGALDGSSYALTGEIGIGPEAPDRAEELALLRLLRERRAKAR